MELKLQLDNALKDAMKSGDEIRKRTVRMVLAAIKQIEIDKQTKLDDTGVLGIMQKEIKTRREAVEEAQKAGRADLVAAAEAEINVIVAFMPKGLSAEELKAIVQSAIAETGASQLSDMGKVMKLVMARVAGRAPGDQISAAVRELLPK